MALKNNYGEDSLKQLKGTEAIRKKIQVYFGTNDEDGVAHGIYEIITNSVDEARQGFCSKINVKIEADGTVTVQDNGRGVPMDWNETEKKWNWELVFCTLHASGKFEEGNYSAAAGTNGVGCTAMNFTSDFMEVWSTRNNKTYHIRFEKGIPVSKLEITVPIQDSTGTIIKFRPDPEVYSNINKAVKTPEYWLNQLRIDAMLHDGLEMELDHFELDKPISMKFDGGIAEFVDVVSERPMLRHAMYAEETVVICNDDQVDKTPFEFKQRVAFNFSREQSMVQMYHDGIYLFDGGATMEALKRGMLLAFEHIAKENGKLSSGKFSFKDIEQMLICVGDTNAPGYLTFFKNQTKSEVTNQSFFSAYAQFIYNNIRKWEKQDKLTVGKIIDEIVINKKAREEAERVSKKVVNSLSKSVYGIGNKPKKFVDCKSRNVLEREIWIVEGDSAAGSCKLARDSQFQGIMPVRGKIINCLKEDLSRVLNSEIIIDLLRIFGCGIEAKSKHIENLPEFNLSKLDWGKIIICTDADVDGMQIRCLVIGMIYKLCPTLLKAGKVYIAETPLFEMSYKKDTEFAYSEEDKEVIFKKFESMGVPRSKVTVNRSKGLGENDPDMMNKSTMNPATRHLIRVEYPEDDSDLAAVFAAVLGNDLETRKSLIQEYFNLADRNKERLE